MLSKNSDHCSTMAQADLNTTLLNIVTHFVEQHGRAKALTEKELKIFTDILRRFNGRMHVRDLPTLDLDRPLGWIREHPERFQIFEDDAGQPVMVGVVIRGVRICPDYNSSRRLVGCGKADCQAFHVCRDHAGGWCRAGEGCRRPHSFTDDHNQRLVEWFRLDGFSCDELFRILALSTPQVCNDYNNKGCGLMGRCVRIHVCRNYVAGTCTIAGCDRAHDYSSAHSKRLLHMYRLDANNPDYIRRHLLFYRVKPSHTRAPVRAQAPVRARVLHALFAPVQDLDEDDDEPTLDELPVLPRRQGRVVGAKAQLLAGVNRLESPPCLVEEVYPVKKTTDMKPSSSTDPDEQASPASDVACSSVPRLSSRKETKPRTKVTKTLRSLRLDRESSREQHKSKKTAEVHIHQKAAERVYICEKNIEDECSLRSKCPSHHYSQPFLWQVNAFDKWVTLEDVNDIIESSFCDPGKDEVLVKVRGTGVFMIE